MTLMQEHTFTAMLVKKSAVCKSMCNPNSCRTSKNGGGAIRTGEGKWHEGRKVQNSTFPLSPSDSEKVEIRFHLLQVRLLFSVSEYNKAQCSTTL